MQKRICDRCKKDITFLSSYSDFIVHFKVETISQKVEYTEDGEKSYDLCSKCWKMIENSIERGVGREGK